MIIILSGTFFSILVMELWGKLADKYGNYRIMCITTIAIPIIPILWILHHSPVYLIFVPALVSGASWAGLNLAAGNYVYDNMTPQKRGLAVSYNNMLQGIGVFFGAGLGAILIKSLTIRFIEPLFLIYIISSIAGMIVVSIYLPKIKEVRKTQKFKGEKVLRNILTKEGLITLNEEVHQIMDIKKYLK